MKLFAAGETMAVKVTFSIRDEILGALVRALAVQAGGFQMVKGLTGDYLMKNGFYRFALDRQQSSRFKTLLSNYLRPEHHKSLELAED